MSKSFFLLSSMVFFTANIYGDDVVDKNTPSDQQEVAFSIDQQEVVPPSDEVSPELSAFFFNKKAPPKVNTVTPEPAPISDAAPPENKPAPEHCRRSPYPMHAGVRHIEGKGIGYEKGYSTLELFFSPDVERFKTLPFLDLRGHVFNDGKFALNAGFGFRYRTSCRTYGANVFYDFRETQHRHYNQIGAGFESLGAVWDFRLNGYLPLGRTDSHWFDTKFDEFKGHYLYLKRKQEFAMRGADAEVGVHFLNNVKRWDLYTAAGPYYFEGKGKNVYGGKLRLGSKWKDFVSLEVSGSYDNVFHGIVQGQIGLYVPFGPRSEIKSNGCSCRDSRKLMERMVQPVARDEIIVVDKHRKSFVALDPSTGDPYFFWFVNNQSSSAGTFESPFPALRTALNMSKPGDIIYIFPGDGTTTGLNAGGSSFQLLDNQQLLGAGIPQTILTQFGLSTIPSQASGNPNLKANNAIAVINLANNNAVSGLSVTSTDEYCIGTHLNVINNATLKNNLLTLHSAGGAFSAISINLFSGSLNVSNNIVTIPTKGGAIDFAILEANASYFITGNQFLGRPGNTTDDGIGLLVSTGPNSTGVTINGSINNNKIDYFSNGLSLNPAGQCLYKFSIQNNSISNCTSEGFLISTGTVSNGQIIFTSNTLENNAANQIDGQSICLTFSDNHSTTDTYDFVLDTNVITYPFNVEPTAGNTPLPRMHSTTPVPENFCNNQFK